MIKVTVDELENGDVIRFANDGKRFTVEHAQVHSSEKSLRILKVAALDLISIPATAEVHALIMWREHDVPCMVCKKHYSLSVNVAEDSVPRGILCGPCDTRTTQEVMARMKEGEEKCDHPNGFGAYGCAGCGAYGEEDDR